MTQNTAAILSKTYKKNQSKTIEFLFSWLNKEDELSLDSKHNLLHLYSLISIELLRSWDLPAKRLSNVVHPSIVKNLIEDDMENKLMLNLHLTFIRYYGQINDGINISKSFNYISDYFSSKALKIEDEIDLVLFFNNWSRYDLTNRLLLEKFDDGKLNEEAVFILLKTLNFYTGDDTDISEYEEVYQKALELNPKKWCAWVDEGFQVLRNPRIKNLYCSSCKVE